MKNIKIVGALIFILSITLAMLFSITSKKNIFHNNFITSINKQKSFTQDVSKNIFYIYRNKVLSTKELEASIKKFLQNVDLEYKVHNNKILLLWNDFYLNVQKFRDLQTEISPYSHILLEDTVKNVYNTNLKLVIEFDKLIKVQQNNFNIKMNKYRYVQYTLFFILVLLLLYLFTQLKNVILFIQKFLSTSKSIITNSSIKNLTPIEVNKNSTDIEEATDNFNVLVHKINSSLEYSSKSIEHSCNSLVVLEQNIEQLIELVYVMNNNETDKSLNKKEDAVIHSLEELNSTANKLKNLKNTLDDLTTHNNSI